MARKKTFGSITFENGYAIVQCAPHVAIKFTQVFRKAHRLKAGVFQIRATTETGYDLAWFRQRYPLQCDGSHAELLTSLVAKFEERIEAIASIDASDYVPPVFDLALPPREYQRTAAGLVHVSGRLLVADELGTGKTVSGICTLMLPDALPALVVTQTHLTRQWESEIRRFAPKLRVHRVRAKTPYSFSDLRTEVGPDKKRRVVKGPAMPDVVIMSYSKIDGWADELGGKVRTVIFDEMQELRRHDSLKRRASIAVSEDATRRIGLTATPVYNYGDEIHSVVSVLDPDALGDHGEFLKEWCSGPKNAVEDPRALGIYLRESGIMIRRTRKDIGREIPELTVIRHVVDSDQSVIADAELAVAELARRILARTGSALDQMRDAGEIDWRMRQATGIAKAPAVIELVRLLLETEQRIILSGWHRAVFDIWCALLTKAGITFAMFTGHESEAAKARSVELFKGSGARVLIMSNRSGAGLDGLQHVCHVGVIGELDWSPKVHDQWIGRFARDGQLEKSSAYYAVAEDGSDPVIEDVLGIKAMQAAGIERPHDDAPIPVPEVDVDRIKKLAETILRQKRQAIGLGMVD